MHTLYQEYTSFSTKFIFLSTKINIIKSFFHTAQKITYIKHSKSYLKIYQKIVLGKDALAFAIASLPPHAKVALENSKTLDSLVIPHFTI